MVAVEVDVVGDPLEGCAVGVVGVGAGAELVGMDGVGGCQGAERSAEPRIGAGVGAEMAGAVDGAGAEL